MDYRKSIVTLVDVLGFSNVVGSKSADQIHNLLARLTKNAEPDNQTATQFEMNFLSFSDTTIRTTPIESVSNKKFPCGLLFHELLFGTHAMPPHHGRLFIARSRDHWRHLRWRPARYSARHSLLHISLNRNSRTLHASSSTRLCFEKLSLIRSSRKPAIAKATRRSTSKAF